MPKQQFTAHSVIGRFPVPPLPAFSKKNIYQVRGGHGKRKTERKKKSSHMLQANRKNEKYVNDLGNVQMFKKMLLIHSK